MDRRIVVLADELKLPRGKRVRARAGLLRHLLVSIREDREALAVTVACGKGLNQEAELRGVMQELAARRVVQGRCGDLRPILAAPQFIRAGEMIERAVALSLR